MRLILALLLALAMAAASGDVTYIRDKSGRLLGTIHVIGLREIREARDANGRKLGYYYPKHNITRDPQDRNLAYGDITASLILENAKR